MALLLITHDLGVARERADRILVMYAGRLMESGLGADLLDAPRHPYTAVLRDSEPPLEHRVERLHRRWPGRCLGPGRFSSDAPSPRAAPSRTSSAEPRNRRLTETQPRWRAGTRSLRASSLPLLNPRQRTRCQRANPSSRYTASADNSQSSGPPALDDVSIVVGAGEAVGVVGESGSGKTTLARCLVGLEHPDSGTIDWASPLSSARRAQIVFQDPHSALNPAMTIGATLSEALRAGGRPRSEVPELLDMIGLPASYARRKPRGLSGGEQQRVAIARALAPAPQLLICDEAVSALDVSVQAQILNLLAELLERLGLALLFITHDLAVVRQVATRLYIMQNGQVVDSGETESILADPRHFYTRSLLASVPGSGTARSVGKEAEDG